MKEHALWLYRNITAVARRRRLAALREAGRVPVAILFYHRVADEFPNAWTLSRADFLRQLDWLQTNLDIVSLAEAQRRIRSNHCNRPTVSITFDDGYGENAEFAIPELVRRQLPATYFVATDFVASGKGFPHDLAAGKYLAPNTIAHLRQFAAQDIEIGAHTRSHRDMGQVQHRLEIEDEIIGSVQILEQWLNRRIDYFAFPYGLPANTTQAAVDVIAAHGLQGFCSAFGEWNWPASPGFHLRRIHADPGLESLRNWLTFDSRKLRKRVSVPFSEPVLQPGSPRPLVQQPQVAESYALASNLC